MNVGFRPRLKARPSLYDLIKNRTIDRLSALNPTRAVDLEELPALPSSHPSTPSTEKHPELVHIPFKMAPKKEVKKTDEDGEDQYGTQSQKHCRTLKLMVALQAPSTPSLGMQKFRPCLDPKTDFGRPVVIAENMIGVAMYELVRFQSSCSYFPSSHTSRFG